MDWDKIFENYIDIKINSKIYSFCDENENWLLELQHIFLHNTKSEMFILIDVTQNIFNLFNYYNISYDKENPKCSEIEYEILLTRVIKKWESAVLDYLNFELEDEENRKFIKYNVTLIVLCCRDKMNKGKLTETNAIIKEERSTSVCRKIFMFNENDYEEELNYLPFYFEKIKSENSSEALRLEKELNELMKNASIFLNGLFNDIEEVSDDNN